MPILARCRATVAHARPVSAGRSGEAVRPVSLRLFRLESCDTSMIAKHRETSSASFPQI
jgi:hypothetical protein